MVSRPHSHCLIEIPCRHQPYPTQTVLSEHTNSSYHYLLIWHCIYCLSYVRTEFYTCSLITILDEPNLVYWKCALYFSYTTKWATMLLIGLMFMFRIKICHFLWEKKTAAVAPPTGLYTLGYLMPQPASLSRKHGTKHIWIWMKK